jgi:hypothetical protein
MEYFVTTFTCLWDVEIRRVNYDMVMGLILERPQLFTGKRMKLPLILASVVAYVALATIWICYAELVALY